MEDNDACEIVSSGSILVVDASAAGSGNLEIMINGGRVACKVRELGSRHYLATFTPIQPITHVVEMRFNGDPVKGEFFPLFAHLFGDPL